MAGLLVGLVVGVTAGFALGVTWLRVVDWWHDMTDAAAHYATLVLVAVGLGAVVYIALRVAT